MQRHDLLSNPTKSQPVGLPKKMPIYKPKREQLVLLSACSFKKFNVFSDLEIGIDKKVQNTILQSNGDEDYDSSDDIIDSGIKKCLKILKKQLTISASERETDLDGSKDSEYSCQTKLSQKAKTQVLK